VKLAAGVLAILLYALVAIALVPEHIGPVYAAALIVMCAMGIGLAFAWAFLRPYGGPQGPMDEVKAERALALQASIFAAAIAATALVLAATSLAIYGIVLCGLAIVWALIWLPAPMRRITATTSVQIHRDPASVFSFVSDERNSPRYEAEMLSVEKVTDGNIGPGTQFRGRVQLPNSVFEGVDEIVDYEWAHRFSERVVGGHSLGILTFELTQDGGTLLSYRYESRVSYPGALVGQGLQRGQLAAQMEARRNATWGRLKQYLESEPDA
jgi:Polyketide cyclase / dehydrase and lipid transport